MKKTILICTMILAAAALIADGAGGLTFGSTTEGFPFVPEWNIPNGGYSFEYFGGYGYGVGYDDSISGGFGMSIVGDEDGDGQPEIAGGVGGVISGYRLAAYPLNLNLVSWTGFGGISIAEGNEHVGYFVVTEELAVELGLPIFRWFMPTVYVGYQWALNVVPGDFASQFFSYSPVMGFRVLWGKFY